VTPGKTIMSKQFGAAYNIPKNISDNNTLAAGYTMKDLGAIIAPALVLAYLGTLLPDILSFMFIPMIGVGVLVSAFIFLFAPGHLGPANWIESIVHRTTKPHEITHLSMETAQQNPEEQPMTKAYEMNSRTQNEIHIERIHKQGGGVERTDGAVVGAVKVDPANMALAANREWEQIVNDWEGYLDNTVDYPIQIYSTTKTFPVEEYMSQYNSRLNDPDVKNRPVLKALIQSFTSWYSEYLGYQGTNQREFYIVIAVQEHEVHQTQKDETAIDRLAEKPVIGRVFQRLKENQQEEYEDDELKQEQLRMLNQRLGSAQQGIRRLQDCSARRITATEHAVVLKEYWGGVELNFSENAVQDLHRGGVTMGGGDPVDPDEVTENKGYDGTGE